MTPAELRARVAAALEPLDPDWAVADGPVDSITPPAFLLVWADPWLLPQAVCSYRASLDVVAISARIEPLPGIETIEALVAAALPALSGAGVGFVQVGAPAQFEIGGLQHLAARITVSSPVTLGGS